MKTTGKIVGLFLVCALVLGALPSAAVRVYAADKVVTSNEKTDPEELELWVNDETAYCAEKEVTAYPTLNGEVYENVFTTADEYATNTPDEEKAHWLDSKNQWDAIRKVLYYGSPNNAKAKSGVIDATALQTQAAVWYFTNGAASSDEKTLALIAAAQDADNVVPDTATLEFYTNNDAAGTRLQAVFYLKNDTGERTPEYTTQAKVDKKTGEPLKLSMDDGAAATKVTDTITYSGLVGGASYTVKGELVIFDESGEKTETVAEGTSETLVADASGSGEWADAVTFTLPEGGLKPYTKYGIVETLLKAEGTVDDKLPDEGLKHNEDGKDDKQNILVSDYYGNYPFDPLGSPEDAEPAIATAVSAGGQTATSEKAVTLTAETAAKVKSITDTITYEGMEPNATYKVTGTLMKVTIRSGKTYVSRVATATEKFVANGVGKGSEWELTIKDVKLQENTTYVLFEEVYDAEDNLVAQHKNPKDKAQTIVVSGSSSGSSPKTADRVWPAALLAVTLIVAGVLILGRRRKTEN